MPHKQSTEGTKSRILDVADVRENAPCTAGSASQTRLQQDLWSEGETLLTSGWAGKFPGAVAFRRDFRDALLSGRGRGRGRPTPGHPRHSPKHRAWPRASARRQKAVGHRNRQRTGKGEGGQALPQTNFRLAVALAATIIQQRQAMLFVRRFAAEAKMDLVQKAFVRRIRDFKKTLSELENKSMKVPENVQAAIQEEMDAVRARDGLTHVQAKAPKEVKLGKEFSSMF